MGRLQGVTVNIEGTNVLADFEVIVVDDNNPYPLLLGINWAIDMNGVINLKNWKMIFEKKSLRVVVPLDPTERLCYIEPTHDYESDDNLVQVYKITAQNQDCVNLTANGLIAWGREISCTSDSDEELEHWQNQLHEVSTLRSEEEDDDLRKINILETEGHSEVEGLQLENPDITEPLKTRQVNIGTEAKPKFVNIGDYSDDTTVDKVAELLREYQDLFPMNFSDLKGIIGDLGVMKITLKPKAKTVKKIFYRLNLKYKERVLLELDKMLVVGIIEPVEESDWVSPIVVQEQKQKDEIRICVDLGKLNDTCMHDPFPTSFTDEVMDNVGGQEAYPFTDGFSGYHQIKIVLEHRSKTTFAIEWGCFQYNMMLFGLKNAPEC
eukprot:PITA_21954